MEQSITRAGSLKRTLTGTTALIGVALLAAHAPAMAANITVSTPTATTQVLGAGDSLTVTNTGSVTASPAVQVAAAAANFVNNSGTLTGGNYGINVVSNGDLSGGIANQAGGTISGGSHGVLVNVGSDISGGVTNSGTISGDSEGIYVLANSDILGGVDNSGKISSGNGGVLVQHTSDISGGITNQAGGTISGGNYGVLSDTNSNISGGITNQAGATISGGNYGIYSLNNSKISGAITNGGTISGGAYGVFVQNGSDISGGITNQAGGKISGGGVGIYVLTNSNISGGIVNQAGGLIEGATGIAAAASKISGGITNAGTIEGTGGTAISLTGLTGSTPITISGGQIIGNVVDNAPSNGFSPVTVAFDFTSQGNFNVSSFSVSPGVAFTFGAGDTITSNAAVSDSGTIVVSSAGSSITGGLNVNAGGVLTADSNFAVNGTLSDAGTINIAAGKTLTASSYVASTGTLVTGLTSTGSANTIGNLVSTGSAVSLAGETVTVNVPAATLIATGASHAVILANGSAAEVAADDPLKVTDNAASFYKFAVAPGRGATADDLLLTATISPGATTNSNNEAVAQVLLGSLAGSTNPQIVQIQNKLLTAPTNAAFNNDLEATLPTVDGSGQVAALGVSVESFNLIGDRLVELRDGGDTGMSAGNAYESGFTAIEPAGGKDNDTSSIMQQARPVLPAASQPASARPPATPAPAILPTVKPDTMMWVQGFGQGVHQGERDDIAGYHADTWGGAAGIDTRAIADHVIAGAAVSYGHTDASSKNANNTDTAVDSYQLTLYGSYEPDGRTYIDGMAAYGWNSDDTTRHDVGGITGLDAQGSYDANQVTAQAEAGREYTWGETILTPNLMVHAVWYDPASYTETGAGGADLHVDGNSESLLEAGPGVKAGWVITDSSGGVVRPQLRAGYRYAVVDDKIEDTSQFTAGGGTFTTQGPSPARSSVDLGTSLRYSAPSNWNFTASYDFDWKSNYTSNAGVIKAGYRF